MTNSSRKSNNKHHTGSGIITKGQVLTELQFAQGQKERALAQNPHDALSRTHVTVLNQVSSHLLLHHISTHDFLSCDNMLKQAFLKQNFDKFLLSFVT